MSDLSERLDDLTRQEEEAKSRAKMTLPEIIMPVAAGLTLGAVGGAVAGDYFVDGSFDIGPLGEDLTLNDYEGMTIGTLGGVSLGGIGGLGYVAVRTVGKSNKYGNERDEIQRELSKVEDSLI